MRQEIKMRVEKRGKMRDKRCSSKITDSLLILPVLWEYGLPRGHLVDSRQQLWTSL